MKKYRLSLVFFLTSLGSTFLGVSLGFFSLESTTLVALVFINVCFILGQSIKKSF